MSRNLLACLALCCAFVAQVSFAAPLVNVAPVGIVGGNRDWLVTIAPDPALFSNNPPNGVGGSLAVELAFSIDDPTDLLSVAIADPSAWPNANPGNNPYTGGITNGIYIDLLNDRSFAAYGSTYLTSEAPTEFLKITTAGTGPTTVNWLGAYGGKGRIAQAGQNFDLYVGSVTVPEPATALLAVACAAAIGLVRRRK